jgi:hypothetical protein
MDKAEYSDFPALMVGGAIHRRSPYQTAWQGQKSLLFIPK